MNLRKHWRIVLLGVLVSLGAVYFIVSELDLDAVGVALDDARFGFLIPSVALLALGQVARAIRWRVLLSGDLPLKRAFHINNLAYFFNGFLPLRLGEVIRAYLAWRADPPVPVMKSAGTIVVERLLDLLSVVVLVAIGFAYGPVPDQLRSAGALFGVLGVAGFLFLVFLSRHREFSHKLFGLTLGRIRFLQKWNLVALLDHFLDGLLPLSRPRALIGALTWTVISWTISIAAGYILMFTFYETASVPATCLYIAAIALAIAVPAAMGNIGVYEASVIVALSPFSYGDSYETAFAFAVTVHAANVFNYVLLGGWAFIEEGVTLEQLSTGVEQIENEQALVNDPDAAADTVTS